MMVPFQTLLSTATCATISRNPEDAAEDEDDDNGGGGGGGGRAWQKMLKMSFNTF